MASNLKTLMAQDKKVLAQSVHTMGGKIKRFAKTHGNPAMNAGEQLIDLGLSTVGAVAVGAYMGKLRADADEEFPGETAADDEARDAALKWAGVPIDLALAGLAVAAGVLSGLGPIPKIPGAPVIRGLGGGAFAYYAGSQADQMVYDKVSGNE